MNGTDKQIEWAERIVTEWNAGFDRIISKAKGRVERNTMPATWTDHVTGIVEHARKQIATLTDAAKIIDMKKQINMIGATENQIVKTWKA